MLRPLQGDIAVAVGYLALPGTHSEGQLPSHPPRQAGLVDLGNLEILEI